MVVTNTSTAILAAVAMRRPIVTPEHYILAPLPDVLLGTTEPTKLLSICGRNMLILVMSNLGKGLASSAISGVAGKGADGERF